MVKHIRARNFMKRQSLNAGQTRHALGWSHTSLRMWLLQRTNFSFISSCWIWVDQLMWTGTHVEVVPLRFHSIVVCTVVCGLAARARSVYPFDSPSTRRRHGNPWYWICTRKEMDFQKLLRGKIIFDHWNLAGKVGEKSPKCHLSRHWLSLRWFLLASTQAAAKALQVS